MCMHARTHSFSSQEASLPAYHYSPQEIICFLDKENQGSESLSNLGTQSSWVES